MKDNPIEHKPDGTAEWEHQEGDIYCATGILRNGKRFQAIRSPLWAYINGLNLFNGSKWLERNGKRYRIQRIF